MKTLLVLTSLVVLASCGLIGGGAPQALYDEYHQILCKAASGAASAEDISRQLELNSEFEKYAANAGHAAKLAKAMDINTCN